MKNLLIILILLLTANYAVSQSSYYTGTKLIAPSNGDAAAMIINELRVKDFTAFVNVGTSLEVGLAFPLQIDDNGEFILNPGFSSRWNYNQQITFQGFVEGNISLDKNKMWHLGVSLGLNINPIEGGISHAPVGFNFGLSVKRQLFPNKNIFSFIRD